MQNPKKYRYWGMKTEKTGHPSSGLKQYGQQRTAKLQNLTTWQKFKEKLFSQSALTTGVRKGFWRICLNFGVK